MPGVRPPCVQGRIALPLARPVHQRLQARPVALPLAFTTVPQFVQVTVVGTASVSVNRRAGSNPENMPGENVSRAAPFSYRNGSQNRWDWHHGH